ncbi:hypothetical protein Cpir12675_001299 [Ceratocystis pirilliformis]|uniref:Succinate dehydrogenase assembly factor 3 n=1 Tax=Ceratocystis pirilliformis TaxID=259994 RepID=A0ABR3ZHS8_9PEZI
MPNVVSALRAAPVHTTLFSRGITNTITGISTRTSPNISRAYASISPAAAAARDAARMPLLRPLALYRRLLRAHRLYLPAEMRLLGDEYVKAEFRAHQKLDNPSQVIGFLTEWQMYLQQVEGDKWKGERMDFTKIERLSEDQMVQLYELMQSIKSPSTEPISGDTPDKQWTKK